SSPASIVLSFFFFHDPPHPETYTLSLHDALPILLVVRRDDRDRLDLRVESLELAHVRRIELLEEHRRREQERVAPGVLDQLKARSEEHTSELQSLTNLVCRLLLEKKKTPLNHLLT